VHTASTAGAAGDAATVQLADGGQIRHARGGRHITIAATARGAAAAGAALVGRASACTQRAQRAQRETLPWCSRRTEARSGPRDGPTSR
jgi:hypothetical protein